MLNQKHLSRLAEYFPESVSSQLASSKVGRMVGNDALHWMDRARNAGVDGISSKAGEVGHGAHVRSFISELRFATEFAKRGFSVSILGDQSAGPSSPDLELILQGEEVYVEVLRMAPGIPEQLDFTAVTKRAI